MPTPRRSPAPAARLVWLVLPLLVVASLWYVQAPPRTAEAYRERASKTAETLRSQVQTARIWVRSVEDGEVTHAAASVGLRESEEDARAAAATFEGYDPPPGTGDLRSRLTAAASETTDALAQLRIAVAGDDWRGLPALGAPLERLAERLAELELEARR